MNLEKIIQKIEETPLDITKLKNINYPVKTKIILYDSINKNMNIEELFEDHKAIIILLLKNNNEVGHYVSLMKDGNYLNYWGPYGYSLLNIISIMGINSNLLQIIKKSNYKFTENKFMLEEQSNKIQTCGLWCVARIFKYFLNNKEFYNLMKYKKLKSDELVSLLTFLIV